MNVNITGINDVSEDIQLLQTGLSSLNDTLVSVVDGLPFQYANLTTFTILSDDYENYKINNNTNLSNNYVTNTTLTAISTAIDDQFTTTITYIDDKATEQHDYTDQEIEALRNEGYIQEAVTQILAWATSDEGKRFGKKVWDRVKTKWLTMTGRRPYTELVDDVAHATSDELDDFLKVYRYDVSSAGIRSDPFFGKDICMKGDTYIYGGNLYLTGDIYKGTFSTTGTWTQDKKLNDYLVMKGVKTNHCLDISTTTDLLELHYDDLDFDLGPAPYNYLKLKYPIHSIHPTQCLSIDATTKRLEFNINADYLEFDPDLNHNLRTRFGANGIDTSGPLSINF